MKYVEDFPHSVEVLENVWIPMPDGVRLAARVWLPEGAEDSPVPAILEYLPYRKRDGTRARDDMHHAYFAGHGYACLRVDIRGSGDSEGLLLDEYLQSELDDGLEILRWIASQPWCSGKVGIMGLSWGGFNGLQIAALDPPELGAVVTVCSSDDRYADDVHYMGGCLLGDNLSWASIMFSYNSCPPDPEVVGKQWRSQWLERLENCHPWLDHWLRHQHRDSYWRHASICEDFGAVTCPVLAASGWADGYTNTVFRLLEQLPGPRMGLVGPWSHKYPHLGEPGPAIGFLQECLRWWDHWLKGEPTGIMDEPMLRAFMLDSIPPSASYAFRPGRWVAEKTWPPPRIKVAEYSFDQSGLKAGAPPGNGKDEVQTVHSPLSLGLFAGKWCSYAVGPDMPHDQREEDGGALVFDSRPLDERQEILGAPEVRLTLAADSPVAMVAARLSDIQPDGRASRISYGLLNLTHRESHEHPAALEPGTPFRVTVRLNDVGWSIPAGHRLRVSVSSSYWPLAWPAPRPVMLTVYPRDCSLVLPLRRPKPQDDEVTFPEPEAAPPCPTRRLQPAEHKWRVVRDLDTDVASLEVVKDEGVVVIDPVGTAVRRSAREVYSSRGDDFDSIRGETLHERGFKREGWDVRTVTRTILTCRETHFFVHAQLDAFEGEHRIFSRNWEMSIERDLV
ncbi:MAG: CocE/NonD family hydrolase [Desulfohalobiaceae bacterium]